MPSESERRQERIDDAIERLTTISVDLNKIVAVHEQRISQQEKEVSILYKSIEKRRSDIDTKVDEIYHSIDDVREKQNTQITTTNNKIYQLEKYIWMAIGGGITISWILSYLVKFIK